MTDRTATHRSDNLIRAQSVLEASFIQFFEVALGAQVATSWNEPMDYRGFITVELGKRSGKPCIRGTRITVSEVLDALASRMSHDQILEEYPYLVEEDILACFPSLTTAERKLFARMA